MPCATRLRHQRGVAGGSGVAIAGHADTSSAGGCGSGADRRVECKQRELGSGGATLKHGSAADVRKRAQQQVLTAGNQAMPVRPHAAAVAAHEHAAHDTRALAGR